MESLNQRYAMLNKRVETLFLDKHKYRDIDYIRIMNQLKETYLKLKQTKELAEPKRETIVDSESDNESEESYAEQQVDIDYDSDGYENYYSSY